MASNALNRVVQRIDDRLIKLEKDTKKSTVPPFGMETLSMKDSLRRLSQLPINARQRTLEEWTPDERGKAIKELGGPEQYMDFLDK